MVQPLFRAGAAAALLTGCSLFAPAPVDDPEADLFVHRAYTEWSPLPSTDGARVAFVLEPRRVDADSHGVMIEGWHGQVSGEGVVVAPGWVGGPLAKVSRGFHDVDGDATSWFVWTEDAADWTPIAPNDPPPRGRFRDLLVLDRATLAAKSTRTFEPPLESPFAFGETIVDTPRAGDSDTARDVRIATYDLATGAPNVVHTGRAFRVESCARAAGVTVAYQDADTKHTMLVDVATAPLRAATLDLGDLGRDFLVLCRPHATRVAIVGQHGVNGLPETPIVEIDRPDLAIVRTDDAGYPAALSTDGTKLVGVRVAGDLAIFTDQGTTAIGGGASEAPIVSGDRAIFDGVVVRLDAPATPKALSGAPPKRDVTPAGGGAFVVLDQGYDDVNYGYLLTRAFFVDDDGEADLPLDPTYGDPTVAYADRQHAFVVGEHHIAYGVSNVELATVDLATRTVATRVPFPLCNPDTIRANGSCSP